MAYPPQAHPQPHCSCHSSASSAVRTSGRNEKRRYRKPTHHSKTLRALVVTHQPSAAARSEEIPPATIEDHVHPREPYRSRVEKMKSKLSRKEARSEEHTSELQSLRHL